MSTAPPLRRTLPLLVLLVALTGCASKPMIVPTPAPPPPPPWAGTLTLWAPEPPAAAGGREALEQRLSAFMAAHPSVQVRLEIKPDVAAALVVKEAVRPDLAFAAFDPHLWPQGCPDLPEDATLPAADWLPGVAAAFAPAGRLCGVPLYLQGQVLALNLAAWKAAGVEPPAGGHWSLEQFETALKALSGRGMAPLSFFALPGYDAWWPLLLADDGRLLDGVGRELTLTETALRRLAAWEQAGLIDPDAGKLPPEQVYAAFAANPPRLAMLPVPARLLPNFQLPPYRVEQLGVAAFPDGANLGRLYGFLLTGGAEAPRRAAAVQLAQALADAPAQVAWARSEGGFPAARGAGNPYRGDAALTAAQAAVERVEPLPGGAWWGKAEPLLTRHLQLAVIGGESPADALSASRSALTPFLREAGT